MQAHGHRARRIGRADDDGDVLREAVLVTKYGDVAVERIGERHASTAQELQRMVAEARRVMNHVAERKRHDAGYGPRVAFETDQGRHEPPRFGELERGRGKRRTMRCGIDVERRAVDGSQPRNARERAQALEIRLRRKCDGYGAAKLARQTCGMCALGGHEHDRAPAASGDEPREQLRLHRFDGRDDEPAPAVGDLHGASTAQLVDGAVERECGGIAVDFGGKWGRHGQKALVSRVLGYQLGLFRSARSKFKPMPSAANPNEMADFGVLEARAWRSLLAAANARQGGPERSDDEPTWLISLGDRLAPAPSAPATLQSLLQLYTPLCTTRAGQSLTIAHLGQSLDGYIATATGDSYYVTGPDNVRHLHRLRALSAAIVVGAGTVARDDPQLTVRHVEGKNPVRVVLDPAARLDAQLRVFTDGAAPTLVVRAEGNSAPPPGSAEVLHVPVEGGNLNLEVLLARLHERGLFSVFVEGGGETVSRFLEAGLLDRLHITIAPLLTGRGRSGLTLAARDKIAECLRPAHRVFTMGGDVLFDCDLRAAAPAVGEASGALERVL